MLAMRRLINSRTFRFLVKSRKKKRFGARSWLCVRAKTVPVIAMFTQSLSDKGPKTRPRFLTRISTLCFRIRVLSKLFGCFHSSTNQKRSGSCSISFPCYGRFLDLVHVNHAEPDRMKIMLELGRRLAVFVRPFPFGGRGSSHEDMTNI